MKRYRFLVNGRVQGVAFRYATQDMARTLGLTGWVRNRADGAVEGEYQGSESCCTKLAAWLEQGPPAARVDSLHADEIQLFPGETVFTIRPSV